MMDDEMSKLGVDHQKKLDELPQLSLMSAPVAGGEMSSTLLVTGTQLNHHPGQKINILRSPSRESVGTDISLFSVSTLASELTNKVKLLSVRMPSETNIAISRGPSPNFDSSKFKRPKDIQEVWFEEPNDMIRGMAVLSSAVGLSKSFSTSDIINLPDNYTAGGAGDGENGSVINTSVGIENNGSSLLNSKRNAISELTLSPAQNSSYLLNHNVKLENISRSYSTWVAIGDVPSTSQLPSPHGGNLPSALQTSQPSYMPAFSPVDLIRSVNKKVRQHYIRRRLLNTYRALERLSQSEFNLDKLEVEAAASVKTSAVFNEKKFSGSSVGDSGPAATSNRLSVPGLTNSLKRQWNNVSILNTAEDKLTVNDVERERGQPLSKYDRNIMIFNWLLTLEPDNENTNNTGDFY